LSSLQEARETAEIELHINRLKRKMDDALIGFYSQETRSDERLWALRESLAEISLRNCKEIAHYIRKVSAPVANELDMRRRSISKDFRMVKKVHDLALLHKWHKDELVPLLNRTEQAGYLVAVTARKSSGSNSDGFTWRLQEPLGGEEHIKRFGKAADEFRYLNQTCPVCGNRIR